MSRTIIMQVDESTKGLMEKVQSGISSSIEESIREVQYEVQNVSDNTESILKKIRHFDSISSSVDELRNLANESKKFTSLVSPLQDEVSLINKKADQASIEILTQKENISCVIQGIAELGKKAAESDKHINQELDKLLPVVEDSTTIKNIVSEIKEMQEHNQKHLEARTDDLTTKLVSVMENLAALQQSQKTEFDKLSANAQLYNENETAHKRFEEVTSCKLKEINDSLEKLQTTLDSVVKLVTPFWKKWGSNHE